MEFYSTLSKLETINIIVDPNLAYLKMYLCKL